MKRILTGLFLFLMFSTAMARVLSTNPACIIYINACLVKINVAVYSWHHPKKPFGQEVIMKEFTMSAHDEIKVCYPDWLVALKYPHCLVARFPH